MKILNGIDIIEVERIKENIEKHGDKFLNRIYTDKEIQYCESKNTHKYESYAARFAAKEAIYKAISNYIKSDFSWKSIEIVNEENGRPVVNLALDHSIDSVDVSLSHLKEYATATAIIILGD